MRSIWAAAGCTRPTAIRGRDRRGPGPHDRPVAAAVAARRRADRRAGFEDMSEFQTALFRLRERRTRCRRASPTAPPPPSSSPAALEPADRRGQHLLQRRRLDLVSSRDLARYEDTGVNWRVFEGYGRVSRRAWRGSAGRLDCEVARIDQRGTLLRLETTRGAIEARAAIVTLPSNAHRATDDLFLPALPDKTAAAAGCRWGSPTSCSFRLKGRRIRGRQPRLWQGRPRGHRGLSPSPVRPADDRGLFRGRARSRTRSGRQGAFFAFAAANSSACSAPISPSRIALSQLISGARDPLARGSYSYARPDKADNRAALAAPVDGRLFFAGEACSKASFSTAHGAYQTGIAAADEAIAALRG